MTIEDGCRNLGVIIVKPAPFLIGFRDPGAYGHGQQTKKSQHNKPKLEAPSNGLPRLDSDIRSLEDSIAQQLPARRSPQEGLPKSLPMMGEGPHS